MVSSFTLCLIVLTELLTGFSAEVTERHLFVPNITEACINIKCPAIEEPLCVKLKHRNGTGKTIYVQMLNKCEMDYMKCVSTYTQAILVPMKYCEHSLKNTVQSTISASKRQKRSADYGEHGRVNNDAIEGRTSVSEEEDVVLNSNPSGSDQGAGEGSENGNPVKSEPPDNVVGATSGSDYGDIVKSNGSGNDLGSTKGSDVGETVKSELMSGEHGRVDTDAIKGPISGSDEGDVMNSNLSGSDQGEPVKSEPSDNVVGATSDGDHGDIVKSDKSESANEQDAIEANDIVEPTKSKASDAISDSDDHGDIVKSDPSGSDQTAAEGTDIVEPLNTDKSDTLPGDTGEVDSGESVKKDSSVVTSGSDDKDHVKSSESGKSAENAEQTLKTYKEDEEYGADCPTACPSHSVMVCARCQHGVYKTFMTVCHMRMFACNHLDEHLYLVSRYPCVLSAPFLSSSQDMDMEPRELIVGPEEDDPVLRFIYCRQKADLTVAGGIGGNSVDPRCNKYSDTLTQQRSKKVLE